jgi:hypothetical protein
VHANFLINGGSASSADFVALMREVRAEVKARQGVELVPASLVTHPESGEIGVGSERHERTLHLAPIAHRDGN